MSYDVYLEIATGADEFAEVYWRNHTSNTAIMWREAGCDIADFEGAKASDFAVSLARAIGNIEATPDHYARWNPPNGWGSVDTTLDFLRALQTACELHPSTIVRVSR